MSRRTLLLQSETAVKIQGLYVILSNRVLVTVHDVNIDGVLYACAITLASLVS